MTLEEKANAYDEAIKRAKNVFNNCYHEETKTACIEIFPEFKENDDEKIRTWIIEELKDSLNEINLLYSGDYDERDEEDVKRQNRLKEAIAYLEKLKGQKSAEWNEEDKKLLDFWLDVIDRNDWRMDENFCKASREFINRLKSLRPQPNQEWSEKDEDMLNAAIEMVENSNTIFCFEVNNHKVSNWLKSLRHQPKQEWSDRDEAFLDSIEDAISSYHDLNHALQYHYWLEEKLNRRPQPKQ